LSNIGVTVLANQQAVPGAAQAFDAEGALLDPQMQGNIVNIGVELSETLRKLRTP